MAKQTMKAVVYKGSFKVAVEEVLKSRIQHPNDAIVKITTTAICGSDLHMYEGRTAAQPGIVFGHENMGIIEEIGSGITNLKVGDRVVMPFNIGCGHCRNCETGYTGFCTNVNPGFAGGAYGYVAMGPYMGGQAEYLHVPYAEFNALKLPDGTKHEQDFILLSDIFPTGWQGVMQSGFQPGESIAVFGAGPVGLMAAYSARLCGASKVYSVDRVKERLDKARSIGAIPINFDEGDPAEQILNDTNEEGVDRGVDAVGFQAASKGKEVPNTVLVSLVKAVRPTGGMGYQDYTFLMIPEHPMKNQNWELLSSRLASYLKRELL
jgi:glutathione-independent formaldehyde dehydrogenase